jgi:hypothetical protein
VAGCAHEAGTYRFGVDPVIVVLDVSCRARDVGSHHAFEGGLLAGDGAVNPAPGALGAEPS